MHTPGLTAITRTESGVAFELVYRDNVDSISRFFARRCAEPQVVADLTSETFVRAVSAYRHFDPARATERAWLYGIARNVFLQHLDAATLARRTTERLGGQLVLSSEETDEIARRIDDQRDGRQLLAKLHALPEIERVALELVDLVGMTPKEAAAALGVSRGALRLRLFRARTQLRKAGHHVV